MNIEAFDFNINLLESLIWQYDNTVNLKSLIQKKQDWTQKNISDFLTSFYTDIYNVDTANGFGLSLWAIILGIKFKGNVATQTNAFGFENAQNFLNGSFVPDGTGSLTLEQQRLIIKLKYKALISNANIDDINDAVAQVINAKALDGLDMSVVITKQTYPSSQELYILENYDIIPRPVGVLIKYLYGYLNMLAFDGSGANFDNTNFGA